MEKLTRLDLNFSGIKGLPFSFRNLTRLQKLNLLNNRNFGAPNSIVMMAEPAEMKASSYFNTGGVSSSGQDKGEETMMSLLVSSNVESVNLSRCNVSEEFLAIGLAWFCNVKELDLSSNSFTILPACLKECRFLRKLYVDDCKNLCEVRGVPPNLEYFSARKCKSWTSSCSSLLLNQELHEAGYSDFTLPGDKIPEWFEHRSRGPSVSFWFRNNIPSILCCAFQLPNCCAPIGPSVTLNGSGYPLTSRSSYTYADMDYIFLFNPGNVICDHNRYYRLLENEWNHVKVSFSSKHRLAAERFFHEMGIHVFNQKSSMQDIRFTDPYERPMVNNVNSAGNCGGIFVNQRGNHQHPVNSFSAAGGNSSIFESAAAETYDHASNSNNREPKLQEVETTVAGKSSMEDIGFTDPNKRRKLDDDSCCAFEKTI